MRICNNCKFWTLPDGLCVVKLEQTRKTDSCSFYEHDECWRCRHYITDTERCRIKGTPAKSCGCFIRKAED